MIGRPFLRVGRPSLLQTAARTAVVAGTATAVTRGMMRREARQDQMQQEAAAYEAQAAMPASAQLDPTAGGGDTQNLLDQLRQLGQLRDSGILTDEEFATQKARLLNR